MKVGYSLQSKPPDGYDIAAFCRQVFAMYDGQLCIVELQCENSLMKAIIDRFGADVPTRIADCAHFIATVEVSVSPPFMNSVKTKTAIRSSCSAKGKPTYNGELSDLHEMILTDENGNSLAFSEQKLDFEVADANEKSSHLLLGDMTQSCDFINSCLPLLRIGSLETEDAEIRFKGNGALCFYIEKEKLVACDFSEVKAAQI